MVSWGPENGHSVWGCVGERPVTCLVKVDERLGWKEPG